MRFVNQAIQKECSITPTVDDIITALNGETVFVPNRISRKGITNSSYMKTQRNYNLSTYSGLFRYERLTFKVNFAAEVFQNFIPPYIANVLNVSDDVFVFCKTENDHREALKLTLKCLHQKGLTLIASKCAFFQKEHTFLGMVFSGAGICSDPQKVQAILQVEAPSLPREVKCLLEMITYSGRFLANLVDLTQPLRELTTNTPTCTWT